MSSSDQKPDQPDEGLNAGVSRRGFLKGTGLVLGVPLVAGSQSITINGAEVKILGPNKTSITLDVNGKKQALSV